MKLRFVFMQATPVVPLPIKQSRTVAFCEVVFSIKNSRSLTGFSFGWINLHGGTLETEIKSCGRPFLNLKSLFGIQIILSYLPPNSFF